MPEPERLHTTVEEFPVKLARNRTANGGFEWWLVVNGKKVPMSGREFSVGVFTDFTVTPEHAFGLVLERMVKGRGFDADRVRE